ncbi:E3 SUMO-protein ligase PIAS2-like isoform X3 [Biomphalaria glabrata]|uniref:E3 SUMO-protein ligase PIAS2-like isoform X3 n=1 Tax=Biomphalaria glabrata TaxID=6526 RepID=A0A9W3ADW0_BIOGL|nr:E3 SUMO-protein ligase PIAS2-like isoform X3 [Biomphalaria glabrata]
MADLAELKRHVVLERKETTTQRKRRLEKCRKKRQEKLAIETEEEKQLRLERRRERYQNETQEQREKRLSADRERKIKARQKQESDHSPQSQALKQMVLSFRVSELHVLLGFAGRNKSGRKQELTQRAIALVEKGCSLPVQIKIREMYRNRIKEPGMSQPHKDINMPVMHRHPGTHLDFGGLKDFNGDYPYRVKMSNQELKPGSTGMGGYPSDGPVGLDYAAPMRSIMPQPPIPVNPDVKLKHLPFYDVLGELMKPSSLIPKNSGRLQETLFVFHLTPQQAQDITMSRDFRPGAKCEYTVQVQLRFCLLETSCEQADTFPSQIQVRVNNKPATLPNVIPTNKPNVEPKRPGRPVDITNLCRLSPTVSNAITVAWAADFTRSFCMAVYLVKKLTSDILLSRLKQFGNRHSDHTKALIKEKLAQDPDSEIATTSLRVSLMCPLGKMRMQIPCRASTCTHLQCFDASTFLMMNERKPTWMCPVCDRPCPYDKLIIDGYFVEIFKQSPSCTDIIFHEDGSWSPMKPQKESPNQVILTPSSKASPTTSQSSASSLPSTLSFSTPVMTTATTATPTTKPPEAKGPVIDLTLDSSDEDDDAVIPSDPISVSPPPVINLDTPSPAPLPTMPGSPTVILSSSQSSSPSPAVASHAPFPSSTSYNGPASHSSNHSRESPSLGSLDSIHQSTPSLARTSPSSSLQAQALNLEAMSDADFDEFLKGLSWGV